MLEFVGKLLAGSFVQAELEKIKSDVAQIAVAAVKDYMAGKNVKHEAYAYLDGILAEGQSLNADKLNQFWITKRAELKEKFGEQ